MEHSIEERGSLLDFAEGRFWNLWEELHQLLFDYLMELRAMLIECLKHHRNVPGLWLMDWCSKSGDFADRTVRLLLSKFSNTWNEILKLLVSSLWEKIGGEEYYMHDREALISQILETGK